MLKTLLLSAAFLLSAVWLQAQDQTSGSAPSTGSSQAGSSQTGPSTGSSQTGSTTGSSQAGTSQAASGQAGNAASVQGCLHNSGGNYILISDSGTTYQLQGDTSKLAEHVEHEVSVTGSSSGSPTAGDTSANAGSAASSATGAGTSASGAGSAAQATINVTGVQHVSKTCTGGPTTNAPTR